MDRTIRTLRTTLLLVVLALAVMMAGLPSDVDAEVLQRRSGGSAIAHRAGKVVDSPGRPESKTYSIGRTAMEPTLGIAPGGDIYLTAGGWSGTPGVQTGGSTEVMHSSDGGESWAAVTPTVLDQNPQKVTLDPYIYVDDLDGDNARIFTIDLTVACSYMSFSDDGGKTWTTNPLACGRPVNDHQTLFGGPPVSSPTVGYPNILYYCWNDVATSSCSKSLDGGISFHPTGAPAFVANCGGLHGHGRVDGDGRVYIPRHVCGVPTLAISQDEGRSWSEVTIDGPSADVNQDPSLAIDRKDNLYYLWIGAEDRLPYLAVSRDQGKSWSKPIPVGPPGLKEGNLPSIDALGTGKIALVYYGSTNSPWPRCHEDCSNADYQPATWNGYLTISNDALSKQPLFFTGLTNHSRDPLVRQRCGPGRCHNVMDFIDVEIGPDGLAYGVFVDTCMPDPAPGCTSQNPTNAGSTSGGSEGLVTKLVGGPSLR